MVPMTPRVGKLLRKKVAGSRAGDWVFTAHVSANHPQTGRRLSERRLLSALTRITERLKLPGHLHTFRHTFISLALMNRVPEAVVRSWVGHVDPEILRHYTHVFDDRSQSEMSRIAGIPAKEPNTTTEENSVARRIGA